MVDFRPRAAVLIVGMLLGVRLPFLVVGSSPAIPDRISRTQSPESGVGCVTFALNDLTCRTREHLLGVPGDCFRA